MVYSAWTITSQLYYLERELQVNLLLTGKASKFDKNILKSFVSILTHLNPFIAH